MKERKRRPLQQIKGGKGRHHHSIETSLGITRAADRPSQAIHEFKKKGIVALRSKGPCGPAMDNGDPAFKVDPKPLRHAR